MQVTGFSYRRPGSLVFRHPGAGTGQIIASGCGAASGSGSGIPPLTPERLGQAVEKLLKKTNPDFSVRVENNCPHLFALMIVNRAEEYRLVIAEKSSSKKIYAVIDENPERPADSVDNVKNAVAVLIGREPSVSRDDRKLYSWTNVDLKNLEQNVNQVLAENSSVAPAAAISSVAPDQPSAGLTADQKAVFKSKLQQIFPGAVMLELQFNRQIADFTIAFPEQDNYKKVEFLYDSSGKFSIILPADEQFRSGIIRAFSELLGTGRKSGRKNILFWNDMGFNALTAVFDAISKDPELMALLNPVPAAAAAQAAQLAPATEPAQAQPEPITPGTPPKPISSTSTPQAQLAVSDSAQRPVLARLAEVLENQILAGDFRCLTVEITAKDGITSGTGQQGGVEIKVKRSEGVMGWDPDRIFIIVFSYEPDASRIAVRITSCDGSSIPSRLLDIVSSFLQLYGISKDVGGGCLSGFVSLQRAKTLGGVKAASPTPDQPQPPVTEQIKWQNALTQAYPKADIVPLVCESGIIGFRIVLKDRNSTEFKLCWDGAKGNFSLFALNSEDKLKAQRDFLPRLGDPIETTGLTSTWGVGELYFDLLIAVFLLIAVEKQDKHQKATGTGSSRKLSGQSRQRADRCFPARTLGTPPKPISSTSTPQAQSPVPADSLTTFISSCFGQDCKPVVKGATVTFTLDGKEVGLTVEANLVTLFCKDGKVLQKAYATLNPRFGKARMISNKYTWSGEAAGKAIEQIKPTAQPVVAAAAAREAAPAVEKTEPTAPAANEVLAAPVVTSRVGQMAPGYKSKQTEAIKAKQRRDKRDKR